MYDEHRMQPSEFGESYLQSIFTNAIGSDDMEFIRAELFSPGNLENASASFSSAETGSGP